MCNATIMQMSKAFKSALLCSSLSRRVTKTHLFSFRFAKKAPMASSVSENGSAFEVKGKREKQLENTQ